MARGVCMAGGHVWLGACMAGCMHGRGCAWPQGHAWPGGHAWLRDMHGRGACMAGGVHGLRGMHGQGACMAEGHAWQGGHAWQILRDTVYERAVRILLECILVMK